MSVPDSALLLDATFIGGFGIAYAAVGARVLRRRVPPGPDRRALAMFGAWWWGISGLFLLSGLSRALLGLGFADPTIHLLIVLPSMLTICIALFGILHYVTYLVSGRVVITPYAAYYSAVFVTLAYGVATDPAQSIAWANSVSRLVILTGPILRAAIVAFLVPVVAACLLYFTLYFRVDDPAKKLRVASTAIAFILWFGSAIVASTFAFADDAWWTGAGRAIGVLATALILVGYWPPRFVRKRASVAAGSRELRRFEREAIRQENGRGLKGLA